MATFRAALGLLLGLAQLALAEPLDSDCSPGSSAGGDSQYGGPRQGAVASESAVCSRIGIKLLEAGGNAMDALVGTTFCVGVIGMYHSGIGGGGFMLVRAPNGTYEFVDFRETAAAAYSQDMYKGNSTLSLYGGLAACIPGEVKGLEYAHKKYGALPWKQVMAPAIKVARDGFEVTGDTVKYMKSITNPEFFTNDPSWAEDFAPNGTLVQLGQIMTRKRYANALETIAEKGASGFYEGAIAESMIAAIQASQGTMTMQDLANYSIALRKPLSIDYKGHKLTSGSAPSGGEVMLSILNIVKGYNSFGDPAQTNLTTQRLIEAMRWSYGMRTLLGDPSFIANISTYQAQMLSEEVAENIRSKISDTATYNVSYYNPANLGVLTDGGTSHIVAADRSGLSISTTTTINTIFGSRLMVPETGIILNNEMNDFSIPGTTNHFGYAPSVANYIAPGKRPLSSISPTIVEYPDGGLFFVSGSAGGSRIITATAQIIQHAIDDNMTAIEALTAPRLHDQLIPNCTEFEYTYNNQTTSFIKSLGHNVTWVAGGATAQALRRLKDSSFEAAGEPRQVASGGFAI